ncbi:hypothetical protein AB0M02_05470 [Actinoplanes sp. NPDC051861]|uniref:hypothetical protein n=1 Tax=Actinoplanes sp. NPDC051861 TaxID=3155170 RepID=UPI00342B6CC8
MTYPPHPGEPNPGYPPAQPGYPPAQPGYPGAQPGYPPPADPGYPGAQPGYPPPADPGYPGAQPGYPPPADPGYPGAQPGYPPPADPGYPGAQPGYSAQPGYPGGQPGYPPPPDAGYPPPPGGYPPAPPGFPAGPPPKKSKALPIALISAAIVLVLCVGGAAAVLLAGKNAIEDAGDEASKVAITEPDTLGGLPKIDDPSFAAMTAEMESSLAAYPGASSSFGAIYGAPEKQNMVAALATKALIVDPQKELDASFDTFGKTSEVRDLADVSTGDLGGVAKCGTSSNSGVDLAICGWADEGSVGMIMWFFKTAADVKADFPKLRAEIETKTE